jgi:glycosyltransferase involved in cell wall biosynthesis
VFSCDVKVDSEIVFEGELIRICIGPYTRRRARTFFSKERKFLSRAISREKLSVLHAQWTYEYALAAIDSGLPYLVTAHDAPLNCLWHNPIPYRAVRTLMAYKAARTAKQLVAVSPYVAEHLRRYRIHTKPIEIIPNGMPTALFARMRRDQPGKPLTFATILFGWGGRKNGEAAIAAFAKVQAVLPGSAMLMFGAGHEADGPAAVWARERRWEAGIEFMGQVPHADLLDLLSQRVDILVHPALEEAHPMAVIEAMSLGIPVIGGRTAGGVPWTLGNGEYGILVDTRSPDQIAAAMIRLAQNDHARIELGQAGRESARRRFHIQHVADRYEAIYAQLVSSRTTSSQ